MRACALLVIGIAACEPEVRPEPPLVVERDVDYCDLARNICERQSECGVFILNATRDVDACVTHTNCGELAARAERPGAGVRIDANALRDCNDALSAATCEELAPWRGGFQSTFMSTEVSCTEI